METELEEAIKANLESAKKETNTGADAMHFMQAALNGVQALVMLRLNK